ncbi:MAG: cache domain-containing protein [Candidatus Omnitrophota bacterium]
MSKNVFMAGALLLAGLVFAGLSYAADTGKLNVDEVKRVVADAAGFIQKEGEKAFPEFKKHVERWELGGTYIFTIDTEGNAIVHPDPEIEGKNQINLKDMIGRPIIKTLIEKTADKDGTGWVHYMWPRPNSIFPTWKSTFAQRVTAPSGKIYIVGCGIYDMKMEDDFIVDEVNEAAALIAQKGRAAFDALRDKTGPFIFLDTYIFVDTPDGTEVVNGGFPGVEGKNIMDFKNVNGKYLVRDYINLALKDGEGWIKYLWPKPGSDKPFEKHTYVKKVDHGGEIFIVGCGAYLE